MDKCKYYVCQLIGVPNRLDVPVIGVSPVSGGCFDTSQEAHDYAASLPPTELSAYTILPVYEKFQLNEN